MIKRKSHTKSRNGCRNCKKRHVKCDEQGPPCLHCIMRKEPETCTFPFLRQPPASSSRPSSVVPPPPAVVTPPAVAVALPTLPPSSSSSSSPVLTENNRILELELMHRWSTRSWTCQETTPACRPYLQEHLPRAALRNGYLLNAILATAAVDLAVSYKDSSPSDSASYYRTALEYGNKAMSDFRTQVTTLTPENVDLVFYFSSLVGVVHFAVPAADENMSVIDRVCEQADLTLKSGHIIAENLAWFMAGPSPIPTVVREYTQDLALLDKLDPRTRATLDLMTSVSCQVRVPPTSPTIQGGAALTKEVLVLSEEGQGPFARELHIYRLAIGQTKYCYAEDLLNRRKAYFHTMFAVAGPRFSAAVRNREPMAVFVLMYWGVLVHRRRRDPSLWVLVPEGRDIVAESTSLVFSSEIIDVPGVREGIAWTRFQVGLPELPGCVLPPALMEIGIVTAVDMDSVGGSTEGLGLSEQSL
ncbi:uncharacterized protein B0H64DRAFT_328347 [Chaetomium fimeti]|uniref:Zn(2)-C6 fungal-type domain-containing protein n=1 Tax=Chaetomium fimeti TaxID=1854472 RepID=A0AAE0H9D7_9PEZI|nr:hypothetical protein B0H64DRAFT_328347 [Chaetomium fimeti]